MKKHAWLLALVLAASGFIAQAGEKQLVLIAGTPSHGPGDHEFNAGCLLLQKCLAQTPDLKVVVCKNGWPKDEAVLDQADAVAVYSDGGGGHFLLKGDHMRKLGEMAKKGVGIGLMHFAVEILKDKGGPEFLEWIGGYYEDHYSCNPMWTPDYQKFPDHPIARGVKPFAVRDEWYMNIRFRPNTQGITPILVAKPSDQVRDGPYVWPAGPYPHVQANKGRDEAMMWAVERPDGGRGFGFTGGHYHKNWANESYRRAVLNALCWIAKVEVPATGVVSTVTDDDLKPNLDPKGR